MLTLRKKCGHWHTVDKDNTGTCKHDRTHKVLSTLGVIWVKSNWTQAKGQASSSQLPHIRGLVTFKYADAATIVHCRVGNLCVPNSLMMRVVRELCVRFCIGACTKNT